MGKHNGKARKTGLPVGKTLENASRRARNREGGEKTHNEQSVLESANVDEVMTLAELAGRDFTADREKIVVLDSTHASQSQEGGGEDPSQLQEKYKLIVRIPRRPSWSSHQTAEELDRQEKESFLNWRRGLALLHEKEPSLLLTPYEKNLEVWRQLWRVLERSNLLVQVVDARDPLLYYSDDLQHYAKELNDDTRTLILLNKSDLVDVDARLKWADFFDTRGMLYAFWSAKQAAGTDTDSTSVALDTRVQILGVDGVLALLEDLVQENETEPTDEQIRRVVGLVGYPNVGKSSTINALYGKKKTPVAPTPGRTKHFQTLNISDTLCLCDCPGLVLPAFAKSKAEMVAAGVIPVDRLVDVVSPVRVILEKIGVVQFGKTYGITYQPKAQEVDARIAVEAMAALALSRGWTQAAGRPDQTRAGRFIIKDFLNGTLVHSKLPPGYSRQELAAEGIEDHSTSEGSREEISQEVPLELTDVDVVAERSVEDDGSERRPRRAPHKFQKKPPRRKGDRGRQYNQDGPPTSSAFVKGSRGTLSNGLSRN